MFGMGFFEILMVVVIAIIFLGPDKLPKAMVDLAKFFRTVKKTLDDAKSSLDKELQLEELKKEALEYKNDITQSINQVKQSTDFGNLNSIFNEDENPPTPKDKENIQEALNQQSLKDKKQTLHPQIQEIHYKKETKED